MPVGDWTGPCGTESAGSGEAIGRWGGDGASPGKGVCEKEDERKRGKKKSSNMEKYTKRWMNKKTPKREGEGFPSPTVDRPVGDQAGGARMVTGRKKEVDKKGEGEKSSSWEREEGKELTEEESSAEEEPSLSQASGAGEEIAGEAADVSLLEMRRRQDKREEEPEYSPFQPRILGPRVVNPFRGGQLKRSPLKASKSFSEIYPDSLDKTDGKKRRNSPGSEERKKARQDKNLTRSPSDGDIRQEEVVDDLLKQLKELNQDVERIQGMTNDSRIKYILMRMDRALKHLCTDESSRYRGRRKDMLSASCQFSQSTQTLTPPELKAAREANMVRSKIKDSMSSEEIWDVARMEWPLNAYRNTKKVPLTVGSNDAEIIFADMRKLEEDKRGSFLMKRIPPLQKLCSSQKPDPGKTAVIKVKEEVIMDSDDMGRSEDDRLIIVAGVDNETEKKEMCESMAKIMDKVHKLVKNKGIQSVTIFYPNVQEKVLLRKVVECYAHDDEVKYFISEWAPRRTGKEPGESGREEWSKPNRRDNGRKNAIIIKAIGDETYADALKRLKEIDLKDIGIQPRSTEKTKNGNIKIRFVANKTKAETLRKSIEEKGNLKANLLERRKEIMVRNVDETMSTKELKEIVARETGYEGEIAAYVPEKCNGRGLRTATLGLPNKVAGNLIRKGFIIAGWHRLRIVEKIQLRRCFKCQAFGHVARNCCNENRAEMCLNCGGTEHKAATCKVSPRCYECECEGHRAGGMSCPEYRRKVKESEAKTSKTVEHPTKHA